MINQDTKYLFNNKLLNCNTPISESLFLKSGNPSLDQFFLGGLSIGKIYEFGIPCGKESRLILCKFLASVTHKHNLCLWINGLIDSEIYPPSWYAQGINLQYLAFAHSTAPIKELLQVFLKPLFCCIIIDSPKLLRLEDYAFLHKQAHTQKQVIIVIHPYFLSNRNGNIWTKVRINIERCFISHSFHLSAIKGLQQKKMKLPLESIA